MAAATLSCSDIEDEELPDLEDLLGIPIAKRATKRDNVSSREAGYLEESTTTTTTRRASPRKPAPLSQQKSSLVATGSKGTLKPPAENSLKKSRSRSPLKELEQASNEAEGFNRETRPVKSLRKIPNFLPNRLNQERAWDEEVIGTVAATGKNTCISPSRNMAGRGTAISKTTAGNVGRSTTGVKLTHVDSLLFPLSKLALKDASKNSEDDGRVDVVRGKKSSKTTSQARTMRGEGFVLREARCNDDQDDSAAEEDDDEDTDLSGFIVDDDAELSYQDTSSLESDSDDDSSRRPQTTRRRRRRLQRGSRARTDSQSTHDISKPRRRNVIEDEDDSDNALDTAMRNMKIAGGTEGEKDSKHTVDLIDLTLSSPGRESTVGNAQPPSESLPATKTKAYSKLNSSSSEPSSSFEEVFDAILRFSPPPRVHSPHKVSNKSIDAGKTKKTLDNSTIFSSMIEKDHSNDRKDRQEKAVNFTTPPATPPHSPTKLKSPSKLILSPSKRSEIIPRSPHRQSVDAFWDLEVINSWNEQYSPKKAPLTSPRKKRFARLSDEEQEDGDEDEYAEEIDVLRCQIDGEDDSSSLPSPCSSPRKGVGSQKDVVLGLRSPSRSHSKPTISEKAKKSAAAAEKRAAVAAKRDFDLSKETLARSLLDELDHNITLGQLAALAASTGGVSIIWSNTLRSTAGRANWRRTVTKPSGSPIKCSDASKSRVAENEAGVKIHHYASIELASKVITEPTRLVSTLAHEFCHLANFMVSGVRDAPHGASFKAWAERVTGHLRRSTNPLWRGVQVTTKHAYAIQYKYLWVCMGRERNQAMDFLNLPADYAAGCGAEYGRHSRSIDTERQRCGRCRGALEQVRPKPRTTLKVDGLSKIQQQQQQQQQQKKTMGPASSPFKKMDLNMVRKKDGYCGDNDDGAELLGKTLHLIELE